MTAKAKGSGKRILQNGGWMLAPKGVGALLSLVYLALIARSLGPPQFGSFALMFSFAQIVAGISAFQTWQLLIRYGTQPVIDGQRGLLAKLVMLCLGLDAASVVAGILLAMLGIFLLGGPLGWDGGTQQILFALTVILLLSSRATPTGLLRLFDDFKLAALAESLVPILRFFGVLLVYITGPSVMGYLMVWIASEMAATFLMWAVIAAQRRLPLAGVNPLHWHRYARNFDGFYRFALWSSLGSTLRLLQQQGLVLIVGLFVTAEAAGFFRLGHQLGQVLARIADAASLAFFVEFARVDAAQGEDQAQRLFGKTVLLTLLSAGLLLLLLLIAGRPLLAGLFGPDYLPAFPFILLLGGAAAVQIGALSFEPALLARGNAGRVIAANLTGAGAMAALLALLMGGAGGLEPGLAAGVAALGGALVSAAAMAAAYRYRKPAGQTVISGHKNGPEISEP